MFFLKVHSLKTLMKHNLEYVRLYRIFYTHTNLYATNLLNSIYITLKEGFHFFPQYNLFVVTAA